MSVGGSNGVGRARVGMRRVDFKGLSNFGVMEAVAVDDDRDAVHGGGVEFGVTDLVGRAVRTHQVDVIAIAGVVVAAANADVGNGNGAIGTLESAATVVNLDLAGGFLVAAVAEFAALLEVAEFLHRSADGVVRARHGLRRLEDRVGGDVVDEGGPTVGGGELLRFGVPRKGLSRAPSVVAGELLGGSVPSRNLVRAPSVVAGKLLGGGVPEENLSRAPTIVTGEFLSGGVPHGLLRGGGFLVDSARDDGALDRSGRGGGGRSRTWFEGREGEIGRKGVGGGRRLKACHGRGGDGGVGVCGRVGHGAKLSWVSRLVYSVQTLEKCELCVELSGKWRCGRCRKVANSVETCSRGKATEGLWVAMAGCRSEGVECGWKRIAGGKSERLGCRREGKRRSWSVEMEFVKRRMEADRRSRGSNARRPG